MEEYDEQYQQTVSTILQEYDHNRSNLLPVLQEIQKRLEYLPQEGMRQVAAAFGIPEVDVYSVATFYNQFKLHPPGRHKIKVCLGTACHMMGGYTILDCFERRLNIKEGETTPDREFSLERVACVGCCTLAPVVIINEKTEGKVTPTRVDGILSSFGWDKKNAEELKERAH